MLLVSQELKAELQKQWSTKKKNYAKVMALGEKGERPKKKFSIKLLL